MEILVKLKGEQIEHVFMEISIFEEKKIKNKRRTKLGRVYINMEMKTVPRTSPPPQGQPRTLCLLPLAPQPRAGTPGGPQPLRAEH